MNHSIMVTKIVFPEVVELEKKDVVNREIIDNKNWVRLGALLDCLKSKKGGLPRITADDLFNELALLGGHRDDRPRMLWISAFEYNIHEGEIPTERRAEIYISEDWARYIVHIIAVRVAILRMQEQPLEVSSKS